MFILRKTNLWKSLVALVALYVLAALVTLRHGNPRLYPPASDSIPVYVLNNGFHTDIALPADRVMARGGILAKAGRLAGDGRWLVYGWGDAGFYTNSGLSLIRAADGLRALFHPDNPSVIRVFALTREPTRAFKDNIASRIDLSRDGFDAMAQHMEASFTIRNNEPVVADVGAASETFFSSREHFSIFRVCNNWTSDQLAAAGLPTSPVIDGNALLFRLDLRLRAHAQKTPG